MLPITMAKLKITSTDPFDIFVLIQDLNTVGQQKGARLQQGKALFVQLQEDSNNQVWYHWAAEQIVEPGIPAYHYADVVGPAALAPLSISLQNPPNGKPPIQIPFMFRPYP
jgi:hypothetical protein